MYLAAVVWIFVYFTSELWAHTARYQCATLGDISWFNYVSEKLIVCIVCLQRPDDDADDVKVRIAKLYTSIGLNYWLG